MTNKSLRDYINLIETVEQGVAEGSAQEPTIHDYHRARDELSKIPKGTDEHTQAVIDIQKLLKAVIAAEKKQQQGVAEGYDSEELANEVYAEFERIYPNLARRADERTIHAAIMDVLNYGGDNDPGALAQDVARAVKQQMQQGVVEGKK